MCFIKLLMSNKLKKFVTLIILCNSLSTVLAQKDSLKYINNNAGWLSLGGRSTISSFSEDGFGIGAGGQFRIQLSDRVNTDFFADYITVSNDKNVRSEYYHVGWSVLFYPFKNFQYPHRRIQPFILAGHCFDYNKKTILSTQFSKDRWGSAAQAGIGTHFNISKRFDITLMAQYMIHLTSGLEVEQHGNTYDIHDHKHSALEGHLLTTVSINYKICKLWKR